MGLTKILIDQLTDLFRIGLIFAMLLTAANTARQLGRAVPIALGIVFVAVLIPSTMGDGDAGFWPAFLVGLVANAIIAAIGLGLLLGWERMSGRRAD